MGSRDGKWDCVIDYVEVYDLGDERRSCYFWCARRNSWCTVTRVRLAPNFKRPSEGRGLYLNIYLKKKIILRFGTEWAPAPEIIRLTC